MANAAHDASGPASTEPAGIAVPQAGPPASSSKGKLRVFISYSRDDLDFADQLTAALDFSGFECFIDREGISGGEEWKRSLGSLISEADTIVFVLTPSSARSPICDWEVEEATRLNKRILPIIYRPLEGVSPPPRLRELNYIFFYKEPKVPGSGFGTGLASLVTALNTDFDWLREHTRYLQRSMEWDAGGRPANRLLSGNDILEAKAWAARRPKSAPEPTTLQLDFIRASEEEAAARLSEQRKQLEAVAAAQASKETALHDREEALKQAADAQQQAADAQRRRTRIRNIALVAVSGLAAVAMLFALLANQQKQQADGILARATNIIPTVGMDNETKKQAFELYQAGAEHGDVTSMLNLGVNYNNGDGVTMDHAKAREWFERAAAKGDTRAMFNLGLLYEYGWGVTQNADKAREWYEKAAKDTAFMVTIGGTFEYGAGVFPRDYAKAREWYEKAAAKDNADAMYSLGVLYYYGRGVPQDYAKAREWFEKAAAKDNVQAMVNLGALYENGNGVTQDYGKAREWYEKAAAQGNKSAETALQELPIFEAETAGRYTEALQQREAYAAKVEAEETKRDGKPGPETALELNALVWDALLAKEFAKALTEGDRAHTLLPHNLEIDGNWAHALMFMRQDEKAKALYLAHKGEPVSEDDNSLWEQMIAEDFDEFRKAGLTRPMMVDIEKKLGISR